MNNTRKKTFLNVKSDTLNSKYDATFVGMDFYSQKWLKGVELAADKIRELSFRYSNADGSSYPIKIYNKIISNNWLRRVPKGSRHSHFKIRHPHSIKQECECPIVIEYPLSFVSYLSIVAVE